MPTARQERSAAEHRASVAFWLGVAGMVVCGVVWLATALLSDEAVVSPVIFGGFGTLVGAAQGAQVVADLRRGPESSAPAPETGA